MCTLSLPFHSLVCCSLFCETIYISWDFYSIIYFLFESHFAWLWSLWCFIVIFFFLNLFYFKVILTFCVFLCCFFIIDSVFQILSKLKYFRVYENLHNISFGIDDIIEVVDVIFLVRVFWVIGISSLSKLLWFFFISIVFISVILLFLTFIIWWGDLLILSTVSLWNLLSTGYSNMSLNVLKNYCSYVIYFSYL